MSRNAPRRSVPPLPSDPKARGYVKFERLCNRAVRAMNSLSTADFLFLVAGKPVEPVIPEGTSALERALIQQESRRTMTAYALNHGYPDTSHQSLDDAWEACLVHLIQSNPLVDWRTITDYLNAEKPPFPEDVLEHERDTSWEEDIVHETRLAADLNAYTEIAMNTVGLRMHLTEEGCDWEAVLNAQPAGSLDPVPSTEENLDRLGERLAYYREQADSIADNLLLFDPDADLNADVEYTRVMAAADAYQGVLQALTGNEPDSPEQVVEESPQEATDGLVSPEYVESPATPRETAQRLSAGLVAAPERIAHAEAERSEHLTALEVSHILALPLSTVRRHLREGKMPGVRIGNQYRVNREQLEAWIADGGDTSKTKQKKESTPSWNPSWTTPLAVDEWSPGF